MTTQASFRPWAAIAVALGFSALSGCYSSDGAYAAAVAERERVNALYASTAACDGLPAEKYSYKTCDVTGTNHCCADMVCGPGSKCCVVSGKTCFDHKDCCSANCTDGLCVTAPGANGSTVGQTCTTQSDCTTTPGTACVFSGSTGKCKATVGNNCTTNTSCTSNLCGSGGKCMCSKDYYCSSNDDCCSSYKCFYTSSAKVSTYCRKESGSSCSSSGECTGSCQGGFCK